MYRNITFNELREQMLQRVGQPGMPSITSCGNVIAAWNDFLRERGFSGASPVGATLRDEFKAIREAHLAVIRPLRSERYVLNRSSLLGHWHRLIRRLDFEAASASGNVTPFQQALRELTLTREVRQLARAIGVAERTLASWVNGVNPKLGRERLIRRLEAECELPPGKLLDLLPYNYSRLNLDLPSAVPVVEYRERLKQIRKDRFRLRLDQVNETLRGEWCALVVHKTRGAPGTDSSKLVSGLMSRSGSRPWRKSGGRLRKAPAHWSLSPDLLDAPDEGRWYDTVGARECRSAGVNFGYFRGFFGWALLPPERGGPAEDSGRPKLDVSNLSLGLFCDQKLLEAFLDWRAERSGGINHWIKTFLNFVGMLCHQHTGFLCQRPEIGRRVGVDDPEAWQARCAEVYKWIVEVKESTASEVKIRRDPKDALRQILDLPDPMDPFMTALKRMESMWPKGRRRRIHARDILLLALIVSNPLRARNLRELTYRPDNTGQLRQRPDGSWHIALERNRLKNMNGAARYKAYDQDVQPEVWPYLENYLKNYRHCFDSSRPELLFPRSRGPGLWKGLEKRFLIITRRFVPGCPGIGTHGIRHIVATTIIMQTRDFILAADTLHDKPETVEEHYAHLLATDGNRQRRKVLGATFGKLRESWRNDSRGKASQEAGRQLPLDPKATN